MENATGRSRAPGRFTRKQSAVTWRHFTRTKLSAVNGRLLQAKAHRTIAFIALEKGSVRPNRVLEKQHRFAPTFFVKARPNGHTAAVNHFRLLLSLRRRRSPPGPHRALSNGRSFRLGRVRDEPCSPANRRRLKRFPARPRQEAAFFLGGGGVPGY